MIQQLTGKDAKDTKVRLTVYVSKAVIKNLKHLAVDEDTDCSSLTELAITQFLKNRQNLKSKQEK